MWYFMYKVWSWTESAYVWTRHNTDYETQDEAREAAKRFTVGPFMVMPTKPTTEGN